MSLPKYSKLEIERRWLVDALPDPLPKECSVVIDRYILDSRLRLRKVIGAETVAKLCKKYDAVGPWDPITNLYLSLEEYELLRGIPANEVTKKRYRIGDAVIDLYEHGGQKLMIFEMEFQNEELAREYEPPQFVSAEITGIPDYSGSQIAERLALGGKLDP